MSTIAYPATRVFTPAEVTWHLQRNLTQRRNPLTRRRTTIEHVGALWSVTLVYTPHTHADMAAIEAFWNRASDADEVVSLWHMARPLPRGTLQANTTTAASASEGASTINITATTGLTLLAGDMFTVALTGSTQLVQVVSDITSSAGVMTGVQFVPPLVGDVANGAAVVVDKPRGLFRLEEPFVPAHYVPGYAPSFPVTLLESPAW